jgi:integrase
MGRPKAKRGSGRGSIWVQGGNTWIRWRQNGRRRTRKFPGCDGEVRETAERALAVALLDLAAGRAGLEVERPPSPPMGELADKWIERREKTHRSADEDRWRWRKHLKPAFGHLRPDEIDAGAIRRFIEAKLIAGLSSSTVRLLVRELSSLFSDIVEQGHTKVNPIRTLPRATRRLIRPAHDPRTTPFVEQLADVRRIFLSLAEPINLAYALGALAGLRNGEALALRWVHVDMNSRRIHVRESVEGPLKDIDSRIVPIQDALYPLLAEWRLRSKGEGRVVQSMRSDGEFLDGHTIRKHLKDAVETLKLPPLTWYQATRHTFASHWILSGQGIETLREIMGHSSVQVTERYAHLRPDLFGPAHRGALKVSLARGGAVGTLDHGVTTDLDDVLAARG